MAPAPLKKQDEGSSSYYSETPPEAEPGRKNEPAEKSKEVERVASESGEEEADYGDGSEQAVPEEEMKESQLSKAEPEVKKMPKHPDKEAKKPAKERGSGHGPSPDSRQSSRGHSTSWEAVPPPAPRERPVPDSKDGPWGPYGKIGAFYISKLTAVPRKSWDKDERVSCPVCWAVKPRNTLWLHLSDSAICRAWQEKYLGLSDGSKKVFCRYCQKRFFREADKDQHEFRCSAQPVPEPPGLPRTRAVKAKETRRGDSREKRARRDESRGRTRRSPRGGHRDGDSSGGSKAVARLRSRERSRHRSNRSHRSPSPAPRPPKAPSSGQDEATEAGRADSPNNAVRPEAMLVQAVKQEPAETASPEPSSASGTGAQASAQDRKISAFERLLALGEKIL